jgi:hypothetical protein
VTIDDDRELKEQDEYERSYEWSEYGDHEQTSTPLEGKDILAIFIASLQTIFLPLVILVIFLLALGLIFGVLL